MKELASLQTLNNKNLLAVMPIKSFDEETLNESLFNVANQTTPTDILLLVSDSLDESAIEKIKEIANSPSKRVISQNEDGTPKVEMVKTEKALNYAIQTTSSNSFPTVFNEAFNISDEAGYKWVSLIEKDDVTEDLWVENFEKYSSEMENISIFFPLVRQISAGNMLGHLNEATWLDGKAEVAGQADLQLLMSWNCLSPVGCMIRVADIKEYSEERDGKFYPLKQNMKVSSSYEFLLRMIYEDIKAYTIPRYGYQMRMDANNSTFDLFSSKIPSNITLLSKEQGGMTQQEIGFWMEQAKSEYFLPDEREIQYEAPVQ